LRVRRIKQKVYLMAQALVIIDVQQGMFSFPELQPHDGLATVTRIRYLLDLARATSTAIFFVQHDGGIGHPLEHGMPGFAFHEALTPLVSESVTVKHHCNSFQETDLEDVLRLAGIQRLTVTGMQSDYCVDTFVRAAKERSFDIRLVADGHTTFDTSIMPASQIVAHHNHTLGGSFAEIVACADIDFG
jgi:nicotinamidase-related amidase